VTGAWRRLSNTVSESVGLKHALRRLQAVPARAVRLVHALVDRMRVGGGPIVFTQLGALRGRKLVTRTSEQSSYYSFKGIRYAISPLLVGSSIQCYIGITLHVHFTQCYKNKANFV
jgi:hypothetical protein